MTNTLKKLIGVLVLVAILFGAYLFLSKKTSDTVPADTFTEDVALKTQKVLADTQKIDQYTLKTEIFTDPRFMSLVDFRVKINDVAVGRPNPFAPVQ